MNKIKIITGSIAILIGLSIITPASASADTFCSSFGTFSSCINSPYYTTPAPTPPKPLPSWFCSVIYTTQAVTTVLPGGAIPTIISRLIFMPTVVCAWEMR